MGRHVLTHTFNTKSLIPWVIAEGYNETKDISVIESWQKDYQQDHRFKAADIVADSSYTWQKMTVQRIIYKRVKIGEEFKNRIVGIECYWWAEIVPGEPILEHPASPLMKQNVETKDEQDTP